MNLGITGLRRQIFKYYTMDFYKKHCEFEKHDYYCKNIYYRILFEEKY